MKNGQKGGKESGKSRREKKLLKDCMLDLLDLDVTDRKKWNKLSKMGIDPEDIDNRTLLTVALFQRAVELGDVNAFKEIRNLIGETDYKDGNEGEINNNIKTLADLINNPKPNRNIKDFEEDE